MILSWCQNTAILNVTDHPQKLKSLIFIAKKQVGKQEQVNTDPSKNWPNYQIFLSIATYFLIRSSTTTACYVFERQIDILLLVPKIIMKS
jgi:hypothetical protein